MSFTEQQARSDEDRSAGAERDGAEASLRDAEERYLALFNAIDQGFCTIEVAFDGADRPVDYRFLEVSPAFERQTGIADGLGRWMREIAPDQDQFWFDTYGGVARTGEPARFENYSTPLDRWWEVYAFRISGERRVAVLFRDITDQKRGEAALRASEFALRELNDTLERQVRQRTAERNRVWEMSLDLFAIMGFDGRLKAINPAWTTTLGRDTETLLSQSFREQVHPDDHDAVAVVMERLLAGETVERFEDRLRHADGSWRWISWTLVPEGDVFYAVGRDVTGERERAAALRLHENIVQSDRSPICAFDTDYRLIAFNQAHNDEFRRINGFESKLGDVLPDLFIPEQQPIMRALMTRALSGERFTVVEEFGRPELGKPCWEISYTPLHDDAGRIIGAFHHARDITDRLLAERELAEAQEQLRQAQKMEAMGQLTGGVAHDFNNLLTPIVGSLDLLQRKGVGGERERRLIDGAAQSAERARTLVQRLLAFARRQPLQTQAVDVVALVGGMADLVASTSGPRVRVEIDVADDLPPAQADANQVEMAILNLAVNARDAMPDGGVLTIAAKPVEVGADGPADLQPGRYVRLSVADTGIGMDEATLARAVDPFFSTKGIDRGTGLGLSMVHGLAAQLGGGLLISSRPRLGTCVELYLPTSHESVQNAERTDPGDAQPAAGVALLVDDEELVRMSTADMLADLGYVVVEAGSGEEALRLLDAGQRCDVLVTDHLMPGMSGTELAHALRARRPGVPILVVSGYTEVESIAPDLPRLIKPFRQADLAAKLRDGDGVAAA